MREEKFKIINFIRELIINIDKNLDNFPKKDIELKNRLRTTTGIRHILSESLL